MPGDIIKLVITLLMAVIALLSNSLVEDGSGTSQAVISKLQQAVGLLQPAPSQTGSETPPPGGITDQPGRVMAPPGGVTGQPFPKDTHAGNTAHTVPEINAIAAPAALALLIGGLLLLGEKSRRPRQAGGQSKPKFSNLAV